MNGSHPGDAVVRRGRVPFSWRRVLFGAPLQTERAVHERLPIILALPIFASDALSSVAYATDAILKQFQDLHIRHDQYPIAVAISVAIIALILMVVVSYWQVIFAYPGGGGSYIVARANLGLAFGLIAASSLLVDYVLTVAVSVSDGVLQATSALNKLGGFWGHLDAHRTALCVAIVLFVMLLNLRGVRESGAFFAGPSYGFIVLIFGMLGVGLYRLMVWGHPAQMVAMVPDAAATHSLDIGVVLRGFASGCAALTGIEAVSNGVQAFKKPEAANAARTLGILGAILAVMFIGITYLAARLGVAPTGTETVISQLARASFGTAMPSGILYYAVQAATAMILMLAVNTAFAGFPRLASVLAEDGFLPRQLATLGDRLAYNNGIIVLSMTAIALLVAFHGESHALLPLYTVGVFIAFTSAQAGMVRKSWGSERRPWVSLAINGLGTVVTLVVLGVVIRGKFIVDQPLFGIRWLHEGAWISLLMVATMYGVFRAISTHYRHVDSQLREIPADWSRPLKHTVLVLVPSRVHRGIVLAINYARSLTPDAIALHIAFDPMKAEHLQTEWEQHAGDMPLIVLWSPYRSLVGPLMEYLDATDRVRGDDVVTVVLPEFVPARWWHTFLHNAHGWILRLRLYYRRDVVITSVRYYLDR